MTARLAVVIPTRDREPALRATLTALDRQEGLRWPLEVVVADDGSRDGTPSFLATARFDRLDLTVVALSGRGPAAARNLALSRVAAERTLLLGDDTRPAPGAVAAHLEAAAGRKIAVQGLIEWDPEVAVTPVMHFLAPAGPQFYFQGLEDGGSAPWGAWLGSNLSAPTSWFRDEPFDERFTDASIEDTELALRWSRRGRRGIFSRRALCWHRHRYDSIEPFLARQRRVGRGVRVGVRVHTRLLWPMILKPELVGCAKLLGWGCRLAVGRARPEDRWDVLWRWALLRGFLEAPRHEGRRRPAVYSGPKSDDAA